MSIKALQEYTRFSKYARYDKSKQRRETWPEQITRVLDMHRRKFAGVDLEEELRIVENAMLAKEVLGSQRALQFGGAPIERINSRMYNCCVSYIDRPRFFQETMFVLLCGCGAGFSAQKHHVAKLPKVQAPSVNSKTVYQIPDSIEGWSDAIGVLMSSYFVDSQPFPEVAGRYVEFDYDLIRPEGSPISHGGKAPGPKGLKASLEKIRKLLDKATKDGARQLRPIEAYDIVMHISDSVLSGGIRRSATICLFSPDDEEMINAKTGDWYVRNPQRGRSNNSVVLVRDQTTREHFQTIMKSVRECGEPGFVFTEDSEIVYNPCVEVGMYAIAENGDTGWQFCNLSEINMKKAKTPELFYAACKAAGILGTLQAAYTDFEYLGETTRQIVEREALLGVSMTGMMDTPEVAFDPEVQRKGAQIVLEVNEAVAKKIGINPAARTTCVKPAGNSSCILGTSSGIHPHHARRYIRHAQANKSEPALKFFQKYNPSAVEDSLWSANNTDVVIKFLCEVPPGSVTKNQINALELLTRVMNTQQNWVESGTRTSACVKPWLRHNVSNTINVKPEEWDEVTDFIYNNRKWFAGISLLPVSGDKDYAQAPFTAVYTPAEIAKEYGTGSILASGLIVDGMRCFKSDLWAACSTVLGNGVIPLSVYDNPAEHIDEDLEVFHYTTEFGSSISMSLHMFKLQQEWVRRAKQFARRYFNDDVQKMTYCLKDVRNWKVWCDLERKYQHVPWEEFTEENDNTTVQDTVACAGGQCEII